MRTTITSLALALAASVISAQANTMSEGLIYGNVQQAMRDGQIDGCGISLRAMEVIQGRKTGPLLIVTGSFNVYNLGGGLAKGKASQVDASAVLNNTMGEKAIKDLPTEQIWFKAPGSPATAVLPGHSNFKSDDPGYILYPTGIEALNGLFGAVLDRKPIQIGVKVAGRKVGEGLFGVVQLSDEDLKQYAQCMVEWTDSQKQKHNIK